MVSTADAANYFDNRQAHGFNAMWIDVLVAGPITLTAGLTAALTMVSSIHRLPCRRERYRHYDLKTPNEAYFVRVDQMLALAADHGMVVFLDPIETGQWSRHYAITPPLPLAFMASTWEPVQAFRQHHMAERQ